MLKFKTLTSVLLSLAFLAACGGSSNTKEPEQFKEINPFANGQIPTEKTQAIMWPLDVQGSTSLSFDPAKGEVILTDQDGNEKVYGFDPSTGSILPEYCVEEQCDTSLSDMMAQYNGEGLVLISDGSTWIGNTGDILGYNPSAESNLPTGQLVYEGEFYADYFNFSNTSEENPDGTELMTGSAVSEVDFNNGNMSVKFTGFSGDLSGSTARLDEVLIDGAEFSEGEMTIVDANGHELENGLRAVRGGFFGKNGQELGGVFIYQVSDPNAGYEFALTGGWNGEN